MRALIDDLLDVTRLEGGKQLPIDPKPIAVETLFREAYELFKSRRASFRVSASRPINIAAIACAPAFGVPSMMKRAPGWRHIRSQTFLPESEPIMARTTRPPIECAMTVRRSTPILSRIAETSAACCSIV